MGQGLLKYLMDTRNILGGKRLGVHCLLQSDDGHNTGMREFFSLHSHFILDGNCRRRLFQVSHVSTQGSSCETAFGI